MNTIKILSAVYLITGLGAAYLSFRIERAALMDFLLDAELALVGSVIFETGKIFTIVLYRWEIHVGKSVPRGVRILTRTLQIGFFAFAIFCSVTFFAKLLSSPNSKDVRGREEASMARNYDDRIKLTIERFDQEIQSLAQELNREMNIVGIGGEFRGLRYREIEARLTAARHESKNEIGRVYNEKEEAIRKIRNNEYLNDPRARNESVNALVRSVEHVLGWNIQYSLVILLFAALTSFLIEGLIYVIFEHLILVYDPVSFVLERETLVLAKHNKLLERVFQQRNRFEFLKSLTKQAKASIDKAKGWINL